MTSPSYTKSRGLEIEMAPGAPAGAICPQIRKSGARVLGPWQGGHLIKGLVTSRLHPY